MNKEASFEMSMSCKFSIVRVQGFNNGTWEIKFCDGWKNVTEVGRKICESDRNKTVACKYTNQRESAQAFTNKQVRMYTNDDPTGEFYTGIDPF